MFEILTYALAKSKATKEVKEAVSSKLDKPANPTIGQILRVKSITDDGDIVLETVAGGGSNGLPDGGTAGQVLVKKSDESFDTEWQTTLITCENNTPSITFEKAQKAIQKRCVLLFNKDTGLTYVLNNQFNYIRGFNFISYENNIIQGLFATWTNNGISFTASYEALNKVPSGGTTNQILAKKSNAAGDTEWIDPQTATVRTAMDDVAVAGAKYFLGEQAELSITMPTDAQTGQEIMVVFSSGDTPCTLSIDLDDFDYVPKANTTCKITFTCIATDTWLVDVKEG